jgi:hypothetical protein
MERCLESCLLSLSCLKIPMPAALRLRCKHLKGLFTCYKSEPTDDQWKPETLAPRLASVAYASTDLGASRFTARSATKRRMSELSDAEYNVAMRMLQILSQASRMTRPPRKDLVRRSQSSWLHLATECLCCTAATWLCRWTMRKEPGKC